MGDDARPRRLPVAGQDDLVEQGRLVRFTDLVVNSPGGYYLTWNTNHELSPAALILRDWLRTTADATRASPPTGCHGCLTLPGGEAVAWRRMSAVSTSGVHSVQRKRQVP